MTEKTKVAMNKVTKDVLLELLSGENVDVVIPDKVTVISYVADSIDQGEKGLMYWARLEVTSTEELELLQSIGLQENANILKVKLSGYQNENLNNLVGKNLDTSVMELIFDEKKIRDRTDIVGLAFKTELKELKTEVK